jgi:hypothetical protein
LRRPRGFPLAVPRGEAAHLRSLVHLIYCSTMAFMFENLKVYQKAMDFADAVCGRTE